MVCRPSVHLVGISAVVILEVYLPSWLHVSGIQKCLFMLLIELPKLKKKKKKHKELEVVEMLLGEVWKKFD